MALAQRQNKPQLRYAGNGLYSQFFLVSLRWFCVMVFLVSGSIVYKVSQATLHAGNGSGGGGGKISLLDLNLPSEMRQARLEEARVPSSVTADCNDKCQHEYERVTTQYNLRTPGWTQDDLERSRALQGNRYRLAELAKTLQTRERPILGVVCGGSITLGHGVTP